MYRTGMGNKLLYHNSVSSLLNWPMLGCWNICPEYYFVWLMGDEVCSCFVVLSVSCQGWAFCIKPFTVMRNYKEWWKLEKKRNKSWPNMDLVRFRTFYKLKVPRKKMYIHTYIHDHFDGSGKMFIRRKKYVQKES